jgi:hypothetical protein
MSQETEQMTVVSLGSYMLGTCMARECKRWVHWREALNEKGEDLNNMETCTTCGSPLEVKTVTREQSKRLTNMNVEDALK